MSDRDSKETVAVRQGIAPGIARCMLAGGLALVVIAFIVAFAVS
jgi:hypothetical protein